MKEAQGRYEDSDILVHHSVIALGIMEDLVAESKQSDFKITVSMNTEDGQRISAVMGDYAALDSAKDLESFASGELGKVLPIFHKIDYVINWMTLTHSQLVKFEAIAESLEIRWGSPATLLILKLFTACCRVTFLIEKLKEKLVYLWAIIRLSNAWKDLNARSDRDEIDWLLRHKPLPYLSGKFGFMGGQLSSLVTLVGPVLTQIVGLYVTFDWSILSFGDSEERTAKSSLPSDALLVFQNMMLFRESVIWGFCVLSDLFTRNSKAMDLMVTLIGDCPVIRLGKKLTIELKEVIKLEAFNIQLVKSLTNEQIVKTKQAHVNKAKIICDLVSDYEDYFRIDESGIALQLDKIMALFGLAYCELCTDLYMEIQDTHILSLISHFARLWGLVSDHKVDIQRVMLFNLSQFDLPYMADLMMVFNRRCSHAGRHILRICANICETIEQIDLEAFDNGVRYDFTPIVMTHGRLVHYCFAKRAGDGGISSALLEHLMTMRRHCLLCQDPMKFIMDLTPMAFLTRYLGDILALMAKTKTYCDIPGVISMFRMIPPTPESMKLFERFIEKFISDIVKSLVEMISVQSPNVQIARQNTLDPGFKSDPFVPLRDASLTGYETYTKRINEYTWITSLVHDFPAKIVYGSTTVEMKTRFISQFFPALYAKVLKADTNPIMMQSMLITMHMFLPTFKFCGVLFARSLRDILRSHCQLNSGGLLCDQYKAFMGTDSPGYTSGYMELYLTKLENFVCKDHVSSVYEPLGRRFSGNEMKQNSWDNLFAEQPMMILLRTFGLSAGVHIDSLLLNHTVNAIEKILSEFQKLKPVIAQMEFDFYNKNEIDVKNLECEEIRRAANSLLQLGVVGALRHIFTDAVQSVTDSMIPGFYDLISSTYMRRGAKTPEQQTFLESVNPGMASEHFLFERVKDFVTESLNQTEFMFFLGLLFANSEWKDIRFEPSRDLFTMNLHLLPAAIETLVQLHSVLFPKSDAEAITNAVRLFFTVLRAIASEMRKTNYDAYCSFVILIDHFSALAPSIPYSLIEDAFPYIITRNCYGHLSDSEK